MPSEYFDFKQFRVYHDKCSMKVGTDGVLLGSWCEIGNARNVLDIGTGSGLIALMIAQRFHEAHITAVEMDVPAAQQAHENFQQSPFSQRLQAVCTDIRNYHIDEEGYDCIVSNPPFFSESLCPPNQRRSMARNTEGLPFPTLISEVKRLLNPNGTFHVILPYGEADIFTGHCALRSLSLAARTDVLTKENKPPKRTMLRFVNNIRCETTQRNTITLCDDTGGRSLAYQTLTKDFYL